MNMLGAGWNMTSSPTAPCAVAVMVNVPWDRTNQQIPLTITLVDSDGRPAPLPTPGEQTEHLRAQAIVEVGRPPGVPAGSFVSSAFALNVPPLPLSPGRYEYRVDVGEQVFHAAFLVR
jgi:hypothetical protein